MKLLYTLMFVLIVFSVNAGTNSVNLVVNGDLEGGNTGWDSWPNDTPDVSHSPTHTYYWSATFWKKYRSRTHPIDNSKNYDYSLWVASSNRVYNSSTTICSVGLEYYDSTETNLISSTTFFSLGGDIGFTSEGVFEGFVFHEVENIDIPDGTEYFCVVKTYSKATDGKIWYDDFYVGEVKVPGTVLMVQ